MPQPQGASPQRARCEAPQEFTDVHSFSLGFLLAYISHVDARDALHRAKQRMSIIRRATLYLPGCKEWQAFTACSWLPAGLGRPRGHGLATVRTATFVRNLHIIVLLILLGGTKSLFPGIIFITPKRARRNQRPVLSWMNAVLPEPQITQSSLNQFSFVYEGNTSGAQH